MEKTLHNYLEDLFLKVKPNDLKELALEYSKHKVLLKNETSRKSKIKLSRTTSDIFENLKIKTKIFVDTTKEQVKEIHSQLDIKIGDFPQFHSLSLKECKELSIDEKGTILYVKGLTSCLDLLREYFLNDMMTISEDMNKFDYTLNTLYRVFILQDMTYKDLGKLFIQKFRTEKLSLDQIAILSNKVKLQLENLFALTQDLYDNVERAKRLPKFKNDLKSKNNIRLKKYFWGSYPIIKETLNKIYHLTKNIEVPEYHSMTYEEVYKVKLLEKASIILKYDFPGIKEEFENFKKQSTNLYIDSFDNDESNSSLVPRTKLSLEYEDDIDEYDYEDDYWYEEILPRLEALIEKDFKHIAMHFRELFKEIEYEDDFPNNENSTDTYSRDDALRDALGGDMSAYWNID